jgi:hypothetical protein
MNTTDFRIRIAAIVCCLSLLSKQITGHAFPGWKESIQLEISTVFSTHALTSDSSYRHALPRNLQQEIVAEPWRQSSPSDLLDRITAALEERGMLDRAMTLAQSVFESDPTVYSVVRRGLAPIKNADVIVAAVDATADVFGIAYDDLETPVRDMYYGLFRRLH